SIRIVPWAALASCWPLPQQLLPVSAAGGGRRRCTLAIFSGKIIFICSFETPAGGSKLLFNGRGRKGKRQLPFPAASLLCEKGISERPQTLRNSETINNPSLNYAQSNAERILNRSPAGEPAFHCFLHSAQTFLQSLCNDVPTGAQCVL
ncbi:MAG: hypothetical protein SOV03_01080, partial [Faecalibacterium sp.]|nr:hypothetical protein [Faecalibacterium sp.]